MWGKKQQFVSSERVYLWKSDSATQGSLGFIYFTDTASDTILKSPVLTLKATVLLLPSLYLVII